MISLNQIRHPVRSRPDAILPTRGSSRGAPERPWGSGWGSRPPLVPGIPGEPVEAGTMRHVPASIPTRPDPSHPGALMTPIEPLPPTLPLLCESCDWHGHGREVTAEIRQCPDCGSMWGLTEERRPTREEVSRAAV